MKKERMVCKESFGLADADLLKEFLQKKALEGWKYAGGSAGGNLFFEKDEPAEKIFAWECVCPDEKGAQARRMERETIERHRKEGWNHEGNYGPLLLFSSKEAIIFEHWGGALGRNDYIFGWLKKQKRSFLINAILFGIVNLFMIFQLFPSVNTEDYLEWGLSGAFCLLYDNNGLVLAGFLFAAFLSSLISYFVLPSVRKGKAMVEEALISGKNVCYGEWTEYEVRKKETRKGKIAGMIISVGFFLLFFVTMAQVSTVGEVLIFALILILIGGLVSFIRKKSVTRKWSMMKRVVTAIAGIAGIVVIAVVAMMGLEKDDPEQRKKEWTALEEFSYPPSYFGLEGYENMEWTFGKSGSIFGNYEELDVYHLQYDEKNPFDYNYYKYTAGSDFLADILRKQALANLKPYRAKKIDVQNGDWEVYRIQWNMETEQWFYSDTILMMKGREILLVNAYLENIPFEKVLEIFLSQSLKLVI